MPTAAPSEAPTASPTMTPAAPDMTTNKSRTADTPSASTQSTSSIGITGGGVGDGGVAVQDSQTGDSSTSSGVPVVLVAVLAASCVILVLLLALMIVRRTRHRRPAPDLVLASPRQGGMERSRSSSKSRRKSQSRTIRTKNDGQYTSVAVAVAPSGAQEYQAMPPIRTGSSRSGGTVDDYTTLSLGKGDRTHAYGAPGYALGDLDMSQANDGYCTITAPYGKLDGTRRDAASAPSNDYQSGDLLVE